MSADNSTFIPEADSSVDTGYRKAYTTSCGVAYQGDSKQLLLSDEIEANSVDLLFMSPPFALLRKKDYGNEAADKYVAWFLEFTKSFLRVLRDSGSLVIDIGGAYQAGRPARSVYHFQLAVELAKEFDLCQEFYWYNPAKLPAPVEWVNVRRIRVKDSVNPVFWFSRDATNTKADNTRVLKRYSDSMQGLLRNGYQYGTRPSGHDISRSFLNDRGGSIPPNLLGSAEPALEDGPSFESYFPNLIAVSNTVSNDRYLRHCRESLVKPHPARFPVGLPAFFIEFLTERGDLVCDPFAGSNVTGQAAESLGRRWISCDLDQEGSRKDTYVRASAFRFPNAKFEPGFEGKLEGTYEPKSNNVAPPQGTETVGAQSPLFPPDISLNGEIDR